MRTDLTQTVMMCSLTISHDVFMDWVPVTGLFQSGFFLAGTECRCWFSTEGDVSISLRMFANSLLSSAFCFRT